MVVDFRIDCARVHSFARSPSGYDDYDDVDDGDPPERSVLCMFTHKLFSVRRNGSVCAWTRMQPVGIAEIDTI